MKRFFFISLICILFSNNIHASYPINVDGKEAMSLGILIYNLDSDSIVYEYESNKVYTPASITKAITSATAISLLDEKFHFETQVYTVGKIKNNTLFGDVIIEASGDATIESKHFPQNKKFIDSIISSLKRVGIQHIEGKCQINTFNFNVDCGVNPCWELEDIAWGYGTGLYALNYKDNRMAVSLNNNQVKTTPHVKDLVVFKYPTLDDSPIELMRPFNSADLYIQGGISEKYNASCSMPCPEDVFIDEFYNQLKLAGITIALSNIENINYQNDRRLIYTHKSPSRDEILQSLMIRSDNLFAESMLRAVSMGKSRKSALSTQQDLWSKRGISMKYITINDGSGLARSNRISPSFMSKVLKWMSQSNYCKTYVSYFPRAGVNGTLKNFLKGSNLEGNIALKTGSLNGVQCYAGYKLDSEGTPTHTVVIMVNNFFCKRAELRKEIENLLIKVFNNNTK